MTVGQDHVFDRQARDSPQLLDRGSRRPLVARTIAAECACLKARQVSRLLTRLYDQNLRPAGLQMSQLSILVAVAKFGENGARIGALALVLAMDRTTLTRNLRPLERAGLLRVARAPSDARVRIVRLTPVGKRALEDAFPLWKRAQKRLGTLLGSRRTDDFRGRLGSVLATVQERG